MNYQQTILLPTVIEKENAHSDNDKSNMNLNHSKTDNESASMNVNNSNPDNYNVNMNENAYKIPSDTIIDSEDDITAASEKVKEEI